MMKPIKKLTTGLLMLAMLFLTLPIMASTPDTQTAQQVPVDSTWILAIAGILLGIYKIHTIQKAAMMGKNI